jgi:hypothetical protein
MATVKISALTELTTTAATDELVIVDKSSSTTKRITVSNLIDLPTAPAGIADNTNKEYNLKLTDVSGTETLTWVEETDNDTTYSTVTTSVDGLAPTLPATHSNKFLRGDATWVVPTDTDTTYSTATTSTEGLVKLEDGTAQTVAANTVTATASRTYGVQLNGTGQAVVNVPWVDTDTDTDTTYSTATASTAGLVKIEDDTDQSVAANAVSATASRTYGVQLNSSDQAVVNVPWTDTDTDTTYSIATDSTAGIIKLEDNTDQTVAANAITTTASRTYGIQLNSSDQAVVNVPWTEGASTTKGFYEHPKEITTAVTISTDYNAVTVGPITYSGAGSITVPSGSTWVIL